MAGVGADWSDNRLLSSSGYARQDLFLQFVPQLAAYGVLVIWWRANTDVLPALGLSRDLSTLGVRWGIGAGCILGVVNSTVILWVMPALGGDVLFWPVHLMPGCPCS